jgi:predicted  nucleic acid-binding Zn-ribbon protein
MVRKLESEFLNPARMMSLRKEICKQLAPVKSVENPQRLRKQMDVLDQRIDQGAEKMLAAPAKLTPILMAKLEGWRQQREALEDRLKALARPVVARGAELDKDVEEAISELQRLREGLHQDDRALMRDVMRELVAKVDLTFSWRGDRKRERAALVRGLIHLRPSLQSVKLVTGMTTHGNSDPCDL